MMIKLCFLLLASLLALGKAACPSGSLTSFVDSSVCYGFHSVPLPYLDAEKVCKTYGGHLVTIPSMFENIYITENAPAYFNNTNIKAFWIGANDIFLHGKWAWLDGSRFNFTDWDTNQPTNNNNFDCGSIQISTGKWATDNCYSSKKPYVCGFRGTASQGSTRRPSTISRPSTPRPVTSYLFSSVRPITSNPISTIRPTSSLGCPNGWKYYYASNACYKVVGEQVSWQIAENTCASFGGHLVSIHNYAEDLFVANLGAPDYYHWLGLYRNDTTMTFYWSDGTPFDYQDWYINYPLSTYGYSCTASTYEPNASSSDYGTWFNYPCSQYNGLNSFICKIYL